MYSKYDRPRIKIKSPIDAFKKCPACGSNEIEPLTDDSVFCQRCDWDSIEIHAKLLAEANFPPKMPKFESKAFKDGFKSTGSESWSGIREALDAVVSVAN